MRQLLEKIKRFINDHFLFGTNVKIDWNESL